MSEQDTATDTSQETGSNETGESKFSQAQGAMDSLVESQKDGTGQGLPKEKVDSPKEPPKKEAKSFSKKEDNETSEGDTQDVNWEKRYKDLQVEKDKKVQESSEAVERMAAERVQQDGAYIHEVAKMDEKLADRVVAKVVGESHGINTYKEFVEASKRAAMPEEVQKLYKEEVEPLKKELEEVKTKEEARERAEAEKYLKDFKEKHPDFKDDVEKLTWEYFDKTELSLEDCYDFAKHKLGKQESTNETEKRVAKNLKAKKQLSAIQSSDSSGSKKGKGSQRALTEEDVGFLEGIGAKKTLSKHGY